MNELISAQETALMLGCSVAAVRKWAHQGRLRRVKVGRLAWFQREEVERIAANGLPPTSRTSAGRPARALSRRRAPQSKDRPPSPTPGVHAAEQFARDLTEGLLICWCRM